MTAPALYDVAEAAALLHKSTSWLQKEVAAQRVPHTRIGRLVLFTDEHIAEIVAAGQVRPIGEHARRTARAALRTA